MDKKRILFCGESSHLASGFGNYTREVLSRLYKTEKYELAELSCYRTKYTPKIEPWKVYPVAVDVNDPLYKSYCSSSLNQYGYWRFDIALAHFKPSIVIDVRDFWNFTYQETSSLRKFYKWILAPTYDSSPPKINTVNTIKNTDLLLFHTEWAKKDFMDRDINKDTNIGPVVSDGVDFNVFKPIEYNKKIHKTTFGIDDKTMIVGTVMRNQKRKLIADLLFSMRRIIDRLPDKNIKLYLHTSFPESEGWDIPALLLETEMANHVLITYRCKKCSNYWSSIYKGPSLNCSFCENKATIACINNPLKPEELCKIYNLFDIYVQYAICEGFGIPVVEAAACGLPIISVDHGAMSEIANNIGGYTVPIKRTFREMETNADRVLPDNDALLDILQKLLILNKQELNDIGNKTKQLVKNNYGWDKTAKIFENIIDSIDISTNIPWEYPYRNINQKAKIDDNTTNREFVYYIVDNIIKDSHIKDTELIESMIRSLDEGFIMASNYSTPYTRKDCIKTLETILNNKLAIEQYRCGVVDLPDNMKYFIEY